MWVIVALLMTTNHIATLLLMIDSWMNWKQHLLLELVALKIWIDVCCAKLDSLRYVTGFIWTLSSIMWWHKLTDTKLDSRWTNCSWLLRYSLILDTSLVLATIMTWVITSESEYATDVNFICFWMRRWGRLPTFTISIDFTKQFVRLFRPWWFRWTLDCSFLSTSTLIRKQMDCLNLRVRL